MKFVFVLAQSATEARELRDQGCGYKSRYAAEKARLDPQINSFYRNLLTIFEMEAPASEEK
jgi:hypothetical protein